MPALNLDKLLYSLSVVLLSAGTLVLLGFVSPISPLNPNNAAAEPTRTLKATPNVLRMPVITSGYPVRVVVASQSIDLPVVAGNYDTTNKTWTIANKKAFYATITSLPNDHSGNTLIYGHNNRSVFKRLHSVTPKAELLVYTDNGYLFHYEYNSSHAVQPTDTSILSYSGPPTVTLQTCGGTWNEVRTLFNFQLKSVQKL